MNPRSPWLALLLGLVLAAMLLATGCGGGDQTSSLTKAQYVKRGDAICKKADTRRLIALEKWVEDHSEEELKTKAGEGAMIEGVAIPSLEFELEELSALGIPSGDEDAIEPIFSGIEEAIGAIEDDPAGIQSYYKEVFDSPNAAARKYGFKFCSEIL